MNSIYKGLLVAAMLLGSALAQAQWELDNSRSSLDFLSIKNDAIAESHHFTSLVGFVSAEGQVQVGVDLDSVETLIPIRNERMRELLFKTAQFPAANIAANVSPEVLAIVTDGGVVSTDIEVLLTLHGTEAKLSVPVLVTGTEGGLLRVLSARPVVVNAETFGLADGVRALQSVAGLNAISTAVPVTFNLVFAPAGA
jgi:polyisoprenoid-binding protein YceI|tara:strand:- start:8330 stop:8920 length:591 start_codon:yes stop_codon:yes gene_type:complete